jgi:hypothetical protein
MSSFDFHDGRSRILPHDYGVAVNHSTIPWHVLSEKDVCLKAGSSRAGLSLKEVEARQKIHGAQCSSHQRSTFRPYDFFSLISQPSYLRLIDRGWDFFGHW